MLPLTRGENSLIRFWLLALEQPLSARYQTDPGEGSLANV